MGRAETPGVDGSSLACFEHHADRHRFAFIGHDAEHGKPTDEIRRGARLAELPLGARSPALPENRSDLRDRVGNVVIAEADTLHGRTLRAGSRSKVDRESSGRIGEKLAASGQRRAPGGRSGSRRAPGLLRRLPLGVL